MNFIMPRAAVFPARAQIRNDVPPQSQAACLIHELVHAYAAVLPLLDM